MKSAMVEKRPGRGSSFLSFAHPRRRSPTLLPAFFKGRQEEGRMSNQTIVDEVASRPAHQVSPTEGRGVLVRAGELVLLCELVGGQASTTASLLDAVAAVADAGADGGALSDRLA